MEKVTTIEIVAGIILLVASVLITFIVMIQDSKEGGLASAIGGGSNDSFYGQNASRTREARLSRVTKIMAFVFFIATLVVNFIIARA